MFLYYPKSLYRIRLVTSVLQWATCICNWIWKWMLLLAFIFDPGSEGVKLYKLCFSCITLNSSLTQRNRLPTYIHQSSTDCMHCFMKSDVHSYSVVYTLMVAMQKFRVAYLESSCCPKLHGSILYMQSVVNYTPKIRVIWKYPNPSM